MSEHRKAFYTVEESEVGNLYYFAPLEHAAGPFKEQRRVEAIIDVDADGCLAGVELIDKMPAPPKAPPMTAPADSELSEIHRTLAAPSPEFDAWVASMDKKLWARFDLSAARLGWEAARRAQAVAVDAEAIAEALLDRSGVAHPRNSEKGLIVRGIRDTLSALTAPPPAQAAGVTEAAKALLAAIDASDLDIKRHTYPSVVERAGALRQALSSQDRGE